MVEHLSNSLMKLLMKVATVGAVKMLSYCMVFMKKHYSKYLLACIYSEKST